LCITIKGSRYRDDYEKFKNWDANPEEPNIEQDAVTMEELEMVSLSDSEDETGSISGQLIVVSRGSVPSCSTSSMLGSSSSPPPSSQVSPMEQAKAQTQRRFEKARGKRQKKFLYFGERDFTMNLVIFSFLFVVKLVVFCLIFQRQQWDWVICFCWDM